AGGGGSTNRSGRGPALQPLCALEGLVGAAAVDRRHFRSHRSEVGHQLAAVMHAMVVGQPQKRDRRSLGHAEEIDLLRELLARGRAEALDSLRVLALVELDDVVDGVETGSPLVLDLRVVDEYRVADAI